MYNNSTTFPHCIPHTPSSLCQQHKSAFTSPGFQLRALPLQVHNLSNEAPTTRLRLLLVPASQALRSSIVTTALTDRGRNYSIWTEQTQLRTRGARRITLTERGEVATPATTLETAAMATCVRAPADQPSRRLSRRC